MLIKDAFREGMPVFELRLKATHIDFSQDLDVEYGASSQQGSVSSPRYEAGRLYPDNMKNSLMIKGRLKVSFFISLVSVSLSVSLCLSIVSLCPSN